MTPRAAILSTLLAMYPPKVQAPEPVDSVHERYDSFAYAVESAARRATCAGAWADKPCVSIWPWGIESAEAILIAVGGNETAFNVRAHSGDCRPDECDPVRTPAGVRHLAAGSWQVHEAGPITREWWEAIPGTDPRSTSVSAWAAITVLGLHAARCRTISGAIAGYAKGHSCTWSGAAKRERSYRVALFSLRRNARAYDPRVIAKPRTVLGV